MNITTNFKRYIKSDIRKAEKNYVRRHRPKKDLHETFFDAMRNIPWKRLRKNANKTDKACGAISNEAQEKAR